MAMKVAFLGLGVMGYPMAGHLKKAGHEVTVYNRTAAKAEKWVAEYGGASAPTPKQAVAGAVEDICENLRAHRDGDDDRRPPRRPARVPSDTFAEAPSSSDESDRGTPAASPATDALRGLLARHRRRAVAARPRSLCRLVAAGCFLVAVLALSGVGAAFLSYHVLGPRVVRAYNIIVHDEL